jgi:hypothetical protein
MIHYADPEVCPCCRMQIPYAASQCSHCAAVLTGPLAQGLFRTLTQADALVAQLTAPAPVPVGVGARDSGPAAVPSGTPRVDPTYPTFPVPAPAARRHGLSAASVPRILLGLGATCLLVAAVVFLAVAWSDLGMGARTAILLTLTFGAAAATGWMGRRGLPAGAEAFGAVFLGFLTLDVYGAQDAGWFGGLGDDGFLVLLGSTLVVAAVGTAVGVTRTGMRPLVGAQLVVAAGAVLVAAGVTSMTDGNNAAVLVAIVLGVAGLAYGAHLLRLQVAAAATGLVAGLWWVILVGQGIGRIAPEPTIAGVWVHLDGWPLLAAAALAATPTLLRSLPLLVRVTGGCVALVLVTVVAVAPAADEPTLTLVLVGLAVVAGGAALSLVTTGAWCWLPVVPTVAAGLGLAAQATALGGQALETFVDHGIWEIGAGQHLQSPTLAGYWAVLLPVMVAAALVAGAVLARPVTDLPLLPAAAVVGTAVALTVAVVPGMYDVPLWSALAVQAGVLGVLALGAVALGRTVAAATLGAGAALLAPLVLATALASDWLTAVTLLAGTAGALAAAYLGRDLVRMTGDALLVPFAGGFVWTALHLADGDVVWRAVPVLLLAGGLAIARPVVEREVTAALTALVAVSASILTSSGLDQTWLAVYLTLAGVLVTVSALLHPGRRMLAWVGLALLTLAQWVRLEQLGVDQVEAYTLPLALVLLAVGAWRMAHDGVSSRRALSAGLGLGLGPSLLLVLVDPVSPRAVLLGLACALLVLLGAGNRWAAPLVAGAGVGAALVLREAQYAQVVPQWVLIGLLGTVLTVVGVTWEQRLNDLRHAAGYVRRLR